MIKNFAAAGLIALMGSAALAAPVDFGMNFDDTVSANDATVNGELITDFDFGNGLTGFVSVFNAGSGSAGEARIYDTRVIGGEDPDLEGDFTNVEDANDVRNMGKALIIQERASLAGGIPDDERAGGSITFFFDVAIDLMGLTYLDGERGASVIANAIEVGAVAAGVNGDNDLMDLDFTGNALTQGITEFTVVYNGSGAIGGLNLQVSAVPLPAGLPLLLLGLGGIGLATRKSKSA